MQRFISSAMAELLSASDRTACREMLPPLPADVPQARVRRRPVAPTGLASGSRAEGEIKPFQVHATNWKSLWSHYTRRTNCLLNQSPTMELLLLATLIALAVWRFRAWDQGRR